MRVDSKDRELADLICRALLAIVAGIRKRYDLPVYQGIVVVIQEKQAETPLTVGYNLNVEVKG
jgi:hypothetical protein